MNFALFVALVSLALVTGGVATILGYLPLWCCALLGILAFVSIVVYGTFLTDREEDRNKQPSTEDLDRKYRPPKRR